jgi:metallo-beta-lactamase class B
MLNVVSACDLGRLATSQYSEQQADLERSFRVLRGLPVDIWVTCHARRWGRYRKFSASAAAENAVEPFIDREGFHAYIDAAEAELRSGRLH